MRFSVFGFLLSVKKAESGSGRLTGLKRKMG
jgi:hypothetical protein